MRSSNKMLDKFSSAIAVRHANNTSTAKDIDRKRNTQRTYHTHYSIFIANKSHSFDGGYIRLIKQKGSNYEKYAAN